MRLSTILSTGVLIPALALAGCASLGGASHAPGDVSSIKVGTSHADLTRVAGQPVATLPGNAATGTCLQYQVGSPPRPWYAVITPNDRVYAYGDGTCEQNAQS